nr:hypothetical protein [Tanacetum cinerariifolium]
MHDCNPINTETHHHQTPLPSNTAIIVGHKIWEKGSLEETVQNAIKSWEMELSHKTRAQDFKTINHDKFKLSVNEAENTTHWRHGGPPAYDAVNKLFEEDRTKV